MNKDSIKPLSDLLEIVKEMEGYPIAKDEDIIELSDPPFFTACPNPYIKDFIEEYGKPYNKKNDDYDKKPFAVDITEGKNDEIYRVNNYHTKVPYRAIMKFIEHYTKPGDIVFDGFCGSGMTGIASGLIGRKAILSDLSPAATFIAYNYCNPIDENKFEESMVTILNEIENECGWMFETVHSRKATSVKNGQHPNFIKEYNKKGKINYTVWSDIFICPYCKNEYDFWSVAVNKENGKIMDYFICENCSSEISKKESNPAYETMIDSFTNVKYTFRKQKPVLIVYSINSDRYRKVPDEYDLNLLKTIDKQEIPYWFPKNELPKGYNTEQPKRSHGFFHVHNFYTKRNLWALSAFANELTSKKKYMNVISVANIVTKMYRFRSQKGILGAGGGPMSGTLYVPSLTKELPIIKVLREHVIKTVKLKKFITDISQPIIQTSSHTNLSHIKDNCIDYIFTDPPFGSNIMYSEMNFIWESWLKVFTNDKDEAIINEYQGKKLEEYTDLMTNSFKEMYRILKPNRWVTVVFHNSKASVWNAIQEAMARSGFVIAQVSVLDKKQGSFKQVTSTGAVKNDLIINAYKPKIEFSEKFIKNAGEEMEVDFILQQLEHLPIRPNIERTEKMLYSKMLAHYVENGFKIRYDSTNFYRLLSDNFTELDGFWFLDNQVNEYNRWKSGLTLDQIKDVFNGQQVLFVSDEKTGLTWLFNFLNRPKTYNEIFTAYQQVATITEDEIPELRIILDNNFILENGKYRKPLTTEEKEEKSKNRKRELDRTFNKLLEQSKIQKGKIKSIRREALVFGFTKCYQGEKYDDILTIADKLHSSVLESSGEIMDFIDIARIKTSGKKKIEDF